MTDRRRVTIVTDSTADLPDAIVEELGIVVVPLTITFGVETFRDGIDLTPHDFLQRLASASTLPTTSQPPVPDFQEVFRHHLTLGNDLVCITISSKLSGTWNAARLASEGMDDDRISVIDSLTTTVSLGLVVIDAARQARQGATLAEVRARATAARERSSLYAVLQTLDYVYKGGRIGQAQAMVGSAFAIKPVLSLVDGEVTPVERVRTWRRALARATELSEKLDNVTDVMIIHSDNQKDADATAERMGRAFPTANVTVSYAGATIMTYAGPGAIGIATLRTG